MQKPLDLGKSGNTYANLGKSPVKVGGSKEQNQWIAKAYKACGLDCVRTWEAESGWVLLRPSNSVNKNGSRDWGLCQQNDQYHYEFIFSRSYRDKKAAMNLQLALLKDKRDHTKDQKKKKVVVEEIEKQRAAIKSLPVEFSNEFKDPYKQLDRCIGIWKDAEKKGRLKTTFYAYTVRNTVGPVRAIPTP